MALTNIRKDSQSGRLTTAGVGEGLLTPKRENQFQVKVRNNSGFLQMIRFLQKDQATNQIDKVMLGEPITRKANEGTADTRKSKPVFGKVEFTTQKLKTSYSLTSETLQENIEKQAFEITFANMIAEKVSDDVELLGIQGDTTISGSTPTSELLCANDGFDKLTDDSILLDAGGSTVSFSLLSAMYNRLPAKFKKNPQSLRYFMSPDIYSDLSEGLYSRNTGLGDRVITGETVLKGSHGIPIVEVPYIPTDKSITKNVAKPAKTVGNRVAPFLIESGVNDSLIINLNAAGAVTFKLAAGGWSALEICNQINSALGAFVAYDDGFGRIVLETKTTGAGATIVTTATADSAYETLGFAATTTTYQGAAASASNTINEGSFIWLTNPQNFIYVVQNGVTKWITEYDKDTDSYDTVIYLKNDYVVEELEACVKAYNVAQSKTYWGEV